MWVEGNAISPNEVINLIFDETEIFVKGQQSDPHEFLRFFIEYLDSALPKQGLSIVHDIFSGKIVNKCICECTNESVSFEEIYDLNLPVQIMAIDNNQVSVRVSYRDLYTETKHAILGTDKKYVFLSDCLNTFFCTERFEENIMFCEGCKYRKSFTRETMISTPPKHLIIGLKTYGDMKNIKVGIYLNLDMTKHCENQSTIVEYALYALISHSGFDNFGHYKSFCKNHINGKWYCFNDKNIHEVSESYILSVRAYIAFYQLSGTNYSFLATNNQ